MKQSVFQAECIQKLAEQYQVNPLLKGFSKDDQRTFAEATVLAAWPVITDLGEDEEGFHCLLVTPTPTSNILNCAICGDKNTSLHIGNNPTAQTGTLVNGICGVAVSYLIGGWMYDISPFRIMRTFPIGESALIRIKLIEPGEKFIAITLEGYIQSSMCKLFRPAKVYLAKK